MSEPNFFHTIENADKSAAQIEAEKTAEALADKFSKEGMAITDDLIEKVEKMKLASRFKEEVDIDALKNRTAGRISKITEMRAEENGEVGIKKEQLKRSLRHIQ